MTNEMPDGMSFRLSRIYAQGWNTARRSVPAGTQTGTAIMATLNPYTSEPERTRWNEGFVKAIE